MALSHHSASVPAPAPSCELCARFKRISIQSLRTSAEGSCQICQLRYFGLLQVYGDEPPDNTFFGVAESGISQYRVYPGGAFRQLWDVWLYTKSGQNQSSWPIVCVGRDVQPRRSNYATIVLDWLRICRETHPKCPSNIESSLPTRVLEVNSIGSDRIQLRVDSANKRGAYIALSHCWGGKIDMTTTNNNVAERMNGISFADLPQNFQDAVTVTRELGIRYLWIDALCIIQDNKADWINESKNMAAIYQNAYMVLGADMSVDSKGGFLDPVEGTYNQDGQPLAADESEKTTIFTRRHNRHGALCAMLPIGYGFSITPLSKRAWTLQEQFLATRMAHFDRKEIMWQCNSALFCECMELDNKVTEMSGRKAYLQSLESTSKDKFKAWYRIVDAIIQRDITKSGDILPALSGLAQQFQEHDAGQYLAGLWLEDIAQGLLWWIEFNEGASRAIPYRAPSWSWASVQVQRKVYEHSGGELNSSQRLEPTWAKVIKSVTSSDEGDPLGAVSGGQLQIYGPSMMVIAKQGGSGRFSCYVAESLRLSTYFDFQDDFHEQSTLRCLFVGEMTEGGNGLPTRGLILRQLPHISDSTFERVGLFGCGNGGFSKFEEYVEWSEVTIV